MSAMLLCTIGQMGKVLFKPSQIRAWRDHRGLTLVVVAAQITMPGKKKPMTASNLSKIERGEIAYTQPLLERLAPILKATPGELIERPPVELAIPHEYADIIKDPQRPLSADETLRLIRRVHTRQVG